MKTPYLNQFERKLYYYNTTQGNILHLKLRVKIFVREVYKSFFFENWQPMDYYLASSYQYRIDEIRWFINECRKIKRDEPSRLECKEIIEYATSHAMGLKDAAVIYFNPLTKK